MSYTFAIIGGGLSASSALCQLVDKLTRLGETGRRLAGELSVIVFEKKGVFGPGLPHSEQVVFPFHITNMCAEDMSVRVDQPGDFEAWARLHPEVRQTIPRDQTLPAAETDCREALCHHYPRAVMGEYLKSRFKEAVQTAEALGISVDLCAESEVVDLSVEEAHIDITVKGAKDTPAEARKADGVLLATGHWFEPSGSARYLPSPWPASGLLSAIPCGQPVGIIGSSLSAVEVVLTLTSAGRFIRQPSGGLTYLPPESPGKLTLHSRNGLLPRVRGRIGRRRNLYLTCSNIRRLIEERPHAVTLTSLFELLDRELTAAYGSPTDWQQFMAPGCAAAETLRQDIQNARSGDGPEGELLWQTVLVEIFPVVRELYLNLALDERVRFDRHFNTLFFMHAATQPVINAEKILALIDADIVSVVKLGRDYRFTRSGTDGPFEFIYTDPQGKEHRDTYPYVVNACGQPRSIESDPAELTRNLLKNGIIQIEESRHSRSYRTGSIVVDPLTHRVIQERADGQSPPKVPLYAVGAMTRGQMIDASMAYGIIRSTAAVADDLISQLHGPTDQ